MARYFYALLILLVLFGFPLSSAHAQLTFDDEVNAEAGYSLGDVLAGYQAVAGEAQSTPSQLAHFDRNQDGVISLHEARELSVSYTGHLKRWASDWYHQHRQWTASPDGNVLLRWEPLPDDPQGMKLHVTFDKNVRNLGAFGLAFGERRAIHLTPARSPGYAEQPTGPIQPIYREYVSMEDQFFEVDLAESAVFECFISDIGFNGPFEINPLHFISREKWFRMNPSKVFPIAVEAVDLNGRPLHLGLVSEHRGDVNVNGGVDVGDATLSLEIAAGLWPPTPSNDVNGDGHQDLRDTQLILKAAVMGTTL